MVAIKNFLAAAGIFALAAAAAVTTTTVLAAAATTTPAGQAKPATLPTPEMIARRREWCKENNAAKRRAGPSYRSPDNFKGAIEYCVRFYLEEYRKHPNTSGWLETPDAKGKGKDMGKKPAAAAEKLVERRGPAIEPVASDAGFDQWTTILGHGNFAAQSDLPAKLNPENLSIGTRAIPGPLLAVE
ncbi:hypothetical protein CORC01_09205 [Colletotrichum orchidophilum]|uniref:Uncharacterized protein n=1 Tax=Colletotrichum orchidophilum TaxID=1209926 RepID=A0A1G4B2D8_9PEZI|nr:uncharacterized protein CORC01_09205 [Colletotrichum orchidophilum]OHE95472.1 hypothetical protein CORC01_09205 [Colletotrichum orchidophilum]